jgi:hypothetical protein
MVKPGARVEALKRALAAAGLVELQSKPPAPRIGQFTPDAAEQLLGLYSAMGGRPGRPLRPGAWDIALRGGLVVELDEDMHFNRYRAQTLTEPWEDSLPWALAYRSYSLRWEHRAGTGGQRWTSPPAEKMFGPADPDGVFGLYGAPRWKQRAFYDSVKDAAAVAGVVRLARISVYDSVAGVQIEDLLRGRSEVPPESLAGFVESRVVGSRG